MKKHVVTEWGKYSPEAYVSNGFIGFRYGKNPFKEVSGFLAGHYYINDYEEVEAPAAIPTPSLEFYYRNEKMEPTTVSQTYDFSCGELTTEAELNHWIKGKYHKVKLTYKVFCSRTSPTILVSSLKVQGEMSEKLRVEISYKLCEKWKHSGGDIEFFQAEKGQEGKCLFHSANSFCSAGAAVKFFGDFDEKLVNNTMSPTAFLNTKKSPTFVFVTSYVPKVMHFQPHNQAQRLVRLCAWYGIDAIVEKNRAAWAKLWESRISIDGADEKWQDAIDASYFYLMSSMSAFSPMSVSPFGLSYPDLYSGHVFWDTESFMYLTPLFVAPDIAKNLLDYRFDRLEAAKNNAKLNGCVGLQFPWESGISGCEVICTRAVHAGEHHINLDVALAFDAYARMHPDDYFLKENAWPVIYGVCHWLESRVNKTEKGYELCHTTGIDESRTNINNDSYTNMLAKKVLKIGAEYSVKLGYGERKLWLDISENIVIPKNSDGVIIQAEGFRDDQEGFPSAAMAYFPYGCFNPDDPQEDVKTIAYHVKRDMKKYCHFPLPSGFFGVFPAWLGDREMALDFYETANLSFFTQPFYACSEWGLDEEDRKEFRFDIPTHFITNRGSFLAGLIMGLTKFSPWNASVDTEPSDWLGENISLPKGWNKITVGKIYLHGKAYRLEATHGAKKAELIPLDN